MRRLTYSRAGYSSFNSITAIDMAAIRTKMTVPMVIRWKKSTCIIEYYLKAFKWRLIHKDAQKNEAFVAGLWEERMNDSTLFWFDYGTPNELRDATKVKIEKYRELHDLLDDNRSRHTLVNNLAARLTTDFSCCTAAKENVFEEYFDTDWFDIGEDEVFVDCGGADGDTAEIFFELFSTAKKYFYFEPLESEYVKGKEYLDSIAQAGKSAAECYNCAVFDSAGEHDGMKTVSLDEVIQDKVTFIKMDIEGAEEAALTGARRLITEYHPKLAICVYHHEVDLLRIPELIWSMDPSYKFALRSFRDDIYDLILYAK